MNQLEREDIHDEQRESTHKLAILIGALVAVLALWALGTLAVHSASGNREESGQFGDSFGAVNALFSGLAFSVLIYTLWLQHRELQYQREELSLTRHQLKRAAEAQESSFQELARQNQIHAASVRMQFLRDTIDELEANAKSMTMYGSDYDTFQSRKDMMKRELQDLLASIVTDYKWPATR